MCMLQQQENEASFPCVSSDSCQLQSGLFVGFVGFVSRYTTHQSPESSFLVACDIIVLEDCVGTPARGALVSIIVAVVAILDLSLHGTQLHRVHRRDHCR